jgi:hypothetical protein
MQLRKLWRIKQKLSQQVNFCGNVPHNRKIYTLLYFYGITAVLGDPAQRLQFCERFLNTLDNVDAILNRTFFTDEAWFKKQIIFSLTTV